MSRSYLLRVSQRADGMDVATCAGLTATSRTGATMKLARMLVEAGAEDGPYKVRNSRRVVLTGSSLHFLATRTCTEASGSPRIAKWSPYTQGASA